jgi:spore coat protein CotH
MIRGSVRRPFRGVPQPTGRARRQAPAWLAAALLALCLAPAAPAQGRGGMGDQPRLLVPQFDRNGDNMLDAEERAAARAALGGSQAMWGAGRGGRFASSAAGVRMQPGDVASVPASVALYEPTVVRTLFLEFDNADWERELATFFNTDVEVPATVIVDGQTYRNVGVRFRGASSFRMVPEGSKRSLNLSFNFSEGDQRLGGYRTLNLLNAMNDPTFVRGVLYSQIARAYLPAPRINYVRVVINGENWGVYLNAQQFNRDFVGDFFGAENGARWKIPGSPRGRGGLEYLGSDLAAYRSIYEIKTRDDPARWRDLINLTRVLNETPPDRLEAALDPILNIDGALRFLAVELALVNSDGYWSRASDYHLYQDAGGRFHVVPHDMNEALGVSGNVQLDPLTGLNDSSKPLRSRLLAVPKFRERYLAYVREIAEQWLDWNTMGPLVHEYQSLIEAHVAQDTRKLYSTDSFRGDVANLRSFVERRRAFLLSRAG